MGICQWVWQVKTIKLKIQNTKTKAMEITNEYTNRMCEWGGSIKWKYSTVCNKSAVYDEDKP